MAFTDSKISTLSNGTNTKKSHNENINDLRFKIEELNEKVKDYENIVFSLEHTLCLHEKDKKQLFDQKMEFESKWIEIKLENESKERTIKRQNDEINKLMSQLRNKQNEFEELKNNNLSQKMNDDFKQNEDWTLLIHEKPIKTRSRAQTTQETLSKPKTENIFSEIGSAFLRLKGDKTKQKSKDDKLDELTAECMKLEQFNEMLKKSVQLQRDELNFLKKSNIDMMSEIGVKQKEIKHLRECLEDNQIGFTQYKEENEQKLIKWKTEKKHWFDEYRKICKENQELINEKRKLEKYKTKYKQQKALSPKSKKKDKEKDKDIGNDTITMHKVTIGSLNENDETLSVPQLLRTFKSIKRNYYDDLIDKMMDIEAHDDEEMDEYKKMQTVIHVLYDTLIECDKYIGNRNDIMFSQIFEIMKNKFNDEFNIWFANTEGGGLQNVFKKYIEKCLQISISIKHLKLRLFPSEFIKNEGNLKFKIDNILQYQDIMQRDHIFDATPNDNQWFCSFPSILQNNNELNQQQILEIINDKKTEKYVIFKSKLWMFQT